MKRFGIFLFIFIFCIQIFALKSSAIAAASCSQFQTYPTVLSTDLNNGESFGMCVPSGFLSPNQDYSLKINGQLIGGNNGHGVINGAKYTSNSDGELIIAQTLPMKYPVGQVSVSVVDYGTDNSRYTASFNVVSGSSNGSGGCNISFQTPNQGFQVGKTLSFTVGPDSTGNTLTDGNYNVVISNGYLFGNTDGIPNPKTTKSATDLENSPTQIGPFSVGLYAIAIKPDSALYGTIFDSSTINCVQYFTVVQTGETNGGVQDPNHVHDIPTPEPNIAPCDANCSVISTGLISLPTDPAGFAGAIMGLILASGGLIALLIIIITGYRILTSQGDPEKIKGARESLTAAIAGLLFIIFSIALLTIIGVNVLHIPGFGSTDSQFQAPTSKSENNDHNNGTPVPTSTRVGNEKNRGRP